MPGIDDATNHGLVYGKRKRRRDKGIDAVIVPPPVEVVAEDNAVSTEVVTQERASHRYAAYCITVTGTPTRIVGPDSKRSRIVLSDAYGTVFLGRREDLTAGIPFASNTTMFLKPIGTLELFTTEEIWAINSADTPMPLYVWLEGDS